MPNVAEIRNVRVKCEMSSVGEMRNVGEKQNVGEMQNVRVKCDMCG